MDVTSAAVPLPHLVPQPDVAVMEHHPLAETTAATASFATPPLPQPAARPHVQPLEVTATESPGMGTPPPPPPSASSMTQVSSGEGAKPSASSMTQVSSGEGAKPRRRRVYKVSGAAAQELLYETCIVPVTLPRGPYGDIAAHRDAIKKWAKSSNLNGQGIFYLWARDTDGKKGCFNTLWCTCGGDKRFTSHSGERNTPSIKSLDCKWHVTIRMGPANSDDPENMHRCVPLLFWAVTCSTL